MAAFPGVYAALRLLDRFTHSEPDPATVLWSGSCALFSRLGLSGYIAGMVFFGCLGSRRSESVVLRGVEIAATVAVSLLVTQAVLVP